MAQAQQSTIQDDAAKQDDADDEGTGYHPLSRLQVRYYCYFCRLSHCEKHIKIRFILF